MRPSSVARMSAGCRKIAGVAVCIFPFSALAGCGDLEPATDTRQAEGVRVNPRVPTAAAPLVSVGRVAVTRSHRSGPGGEPGIHTEVTLAPSHGETAVTFWVPGGQVGRLRRVVSHVPAFEVGQQVHVQLEQRHQAHWYVALHRTEP
jgi:hypothetical protein